MTVKQVIVVRKDLNMRKGKIAAQVAHASMKFMLEDAKWGDGCGMRSPNVISRVCSDKEREWLQGLFMKIVAYVTSEQELTDLMVKGKAAGLQVFPIMDFGLTEFHGVSTLTCAAFGPDTPEKLDPVTGKLPLL